MLYNLKRICVLLFIFLQILLLCSCNNGLSNGKYIFSNEDYILIDDNTIKVFEDAKEKHSCEFECNDNMITFDTGEETIKYNFENNVIFDDSPTTNGIIPDGERFNAICSDEDYVYILTFRDDGTFNKTIDFTNLYSFLNRSSSFDGYYTRKENLITITYETGGINYFYTKDGKLYDTAYVYRD